MSDASQDGAGTWHRVRLRQGMLPGAADGAKRDTAPSRSPWCQCREGERDHGRAAAVAGILPGTQTWRDSRSPDTLAEFGRV